MILAIRGDLLPIIVDRLMNLKKCKHTRDRDPYRVERHVPPGTDTSSEAERQVEVDEPWVCRVDEALRVELVRVREHFRVFRDRAFNDRKKGRQE